MLAEAVGLGDGQLGARVALAAAPVPSAPDRHLAASPPPAAAAPVCATARPRPLVFAARGVLPASRCNRLRPLVGPAELGAGAAAVEPLLRLFPAPGPGGRPARGLLLSRLWGQPVERCVVARSSPVPRATLCDWSEPKTGLSRDSRCLCRNVDVESCKQSRFA